MKLIKNYPRLMGLLVAAVIIALIIVYLKYQKLGPGPHHGSSSGAIIRVQG